MDQHDEYRRGRAVDRQDAPTVEGKTGVLTHMVVEESEEVGVGVGVGVLVTVQFCKFNYHLLSHVMCS